ncbi:LIC_10202 family protein [Leptospira noguchii]|uniref:Uncharacterized protein n=3 Tax=Leptospira noguchii TaxID=28182 RepID=M6YGF0_9LEPT|nr:hypothetical protein [Leptospira noguchii]EKR75078.1 hypothetical protein LEP1GSC041_1296 [Leptospira noguchii str. 2006001870]EMI60486.1 hypothetical protein LEP1GSC072_2431 [Leptospira noguchii str. Bonito]EMN02752.1 hypothetical protein LEP1GSC035_2159 [Leptospira noguchii str. 2007001578]EMO42538.1 hypothetical protein LEP1GSC186_4166 [Leptospira noguchii serovar Autumnalis str. ZUN142]EMO88709.1 hypothetical protein LEP1GSC024_4845 [Leptospira noguchii str. 2001034031]
MEDKFQELFEIRDSRINVREIMEEIESKLKKNPSTKEDIEKLTHWKFSPPSPEGYRDFDPSEIAHLFEKGISPPKFTNPKLRFVKGPLKWLLIRFAEFYSFLDKKLSENRTRAFYSVLHELILIRSENQNLKRKMESFYSEFLEWNQAIGKEVRPEFLWANENIYSEDSIQESENFLLESVDPSEKVLVLSPGWGKILKQLLKLGAKFDSISWNKSCAEFIKNSITTSIQLEEPGEVPKSCSEYSKIIISENLSIHPHWLIEKTLKNLSLKVLPGTEIRFRFSNENSNYPSPFLPLRLTRVQEPLIRDYLKQLGFRNIIEKKSEDGFTVLSFRK